MKLCVTSSQVVQDNGQGDHIEIAAVDRLQLAGKIKHAVNVPVIVADAQYLTVISFQIANSRRSLSGFEFMEISLSFRAEGVEITVEEVLEVLFCHRDGDRVGVYRELY